VNKEKIGLFFLCILIAAGLCVGHIIGSRMMLAAVLAGFLVLSAIVSWRGMAMPFLLFFLPWSTIMKLQSGGHSAYTIALMTVCMLLFLKQGGRMNKGALLAAFLLFDISLCSRLLQGESVSLPYMLLIILFFFFPNVLEDCKDRGCFKTMILFFSGGIVIAALSAKMLAGVSGISTFIDVYNWNGIVRLSGYYGDANFYAAHITSALGGILLLMALEKKQGFLLMYGATAILLLYCGLLSASKSFVLTLAALLFFWIVLLLQKRRWYLLLLVCMSGFVLLFSGLLSNGIAMVLRRFSDGGSFSQLTTGRLELWLNYIRTLLRDAKLCFMGIGLENIKLGGRSSHSTILQIFYQLGLIGMVPLCLWEWAFFKESLHRFRDHLPQILLIGSGIFMPWLALDLLFFDEFFLLQVVFAVGLLYEKGGRI